MYQDGVCRVTPRTFSKCIEFTDISYQLAQADTKTAIFENLCDLYNYLDASIHVQFSFINRKIDPKQYAKSFEIRAQGDDFDDIRSEYSDILQDQLVNGNNGLMKRKFMTYTIEADSLKMARARLRRIETDLLGYFKSMGASAWGLDAKERLEVMHSIFHPDGEPFSFDWKWLAPSGLSTKDFIAPSSFRFGNARMFGLGGKYGAVSFLQILSPELSDEMLADFLNTENGIVVNLHVQAIDQSDAIKTVKRKITDLDAMKIQEQKRAVRSGYDMDILPSDLATYGQDAKELLKTLQSRNERMFQLTFLVLNTADTRQKLENDVFCGPSCVFTNDLTPRAKYPKGSAGYKRTLVKEGASIGANATVVCGHTVGKWALIGAGAVVASNVPDHALMLGVPAKQCGWVCECGQKLCPDHVAQFRCPDCGRTYQLKEEQLEEIK